MFATMLHTHVHGTQVVLRLMNETTGKEIRTIDQDLNYDFNFQEIRYLKEPVELPKGHCNIFYMLNHFTQTNLGMRATHNCMRTISISTVSLRFGHKLQNLGTISRLIYFHVLIFFFNFVIEVIEVNPVQNLIHSNFISRQR